MPSFSNNTLSSIFNRILQINQSDNSGVDATTRNIQSGNGASTAISLSDDVVQVQPITDDTTSAFSVKD